MWLEISVSVTWLNTSSAVHKTRAGHDPAGVGCEQCWRGQARGCSHTLSWCSNILRIFCAEIVKTGIQNRILDDKLALRNWSTLVDQLLIIQTILSSIINFCNKFDGCVIKP